MQLSNLPLGAASLSQGIITWARAYPDSCLVPFIANVDDVGAATNFAESLHGFVATMMAAEIEGQNQQSLKALLYPLVRARVEAMNAGRLSETDKGLSASLISVDHSTFAYLRPLYHAPGLEHPFRSEAEYLQLVDKLLDASIPQIQRATVGKDTVSALAGMVRELFANTHEHARTNFDGTPWRRSVRGIHFRFHYVARGHPTAAARSLPSLRAYLADHGRHWQSDAANMTFVELSIFDSGPGLAPRVLGRPLGRISLSEEMSAVRMCFLKHVSSKQHPNAGLGLFRTLALLKQQNGYLRIRTGRLSLFKSFRPSDVGNFNEALTSADTNLEPATVDTVREFRPASGTLVSIIMPVGKPK
jgi:hypothetical protein